MKDAMPTAVDLHTAFGGRGTAGKIQDVARQLIEAERSGRYMRDAEFQTNDRVSFKVTATFAGTSGAGLSSVMTDWLDFGTTRFQSEPAICGGSMRLKQAGELNLPNDKTGLDPITCFPSMPQVVAFRTDAQGLINGAKIICFAIGTLPDAGYKVQIDVSFFGTAVTKA
jgi:hypothetical protein